MRKLPDSEPFEAWNISAFSFQQILRCSASFAFSIIPESSVDESDHSKINKLTKLIFIQEFLESKFPNISVKRNHSIQANLLTTLLEADGAYPEIKIINGRNELSFDLILFRKARAYLFFFNQRNQRVFPDLDLDILPFEYSSWIISSIMDIRNFVLVTPYYDELKKDMIFVQRSFKRRVEFHWKEKIEPTYQKGMELIKLRETFLGKEGSQCAMGSDDQCQYIQRCLNIDRQRHILGYKGFFKNHRYELLKRGIWDFLDAPLSLAFSRNDKIIIKQETAGQDHIESASIERWLQRDDIGLKLSALTYPLVFMDFEAFKFGYRLSHGWNINYHIPFQFSLQVVKPNQQAVVEHVHLDEGGSNIHAEFIERLLEYLTPLLKHDAKIIVYNQGFESRILRELGKQFPKYSEEIDRIIDAMVDLMDIFRAKHFYSKSQMGGYGLKVVFPAMLKYVPISQRLTAKTYDSLEIRSGLEAVIVYSKLCLSRSSLGTHQLSKDDQVVMKTNLLEYCGLDTLCMYDILQGLNNIAYQSHEKPVGSE